jgi:hypothetical protein
MKWVKRAFAAHVIASYFAYAAVMLTILAFHPSAFKGTWLASLTRGVFSPVFVPLFLAFVILGYFQLYRNVVVILATYGLAMGLILAGWWKIDARKKLDRERIRLGLCRWCGYDLRASPGRCPECGKVQIISEMNSG